MMSTRRTWRFTDGVLLAGLTALAFASTWAIWSDIFTIGLRSEEQSHILLAPAIVAWLAWMRRARLRLCRPRWTPLGPLVVALGWLGAWYGFGNGIQALWHLGAVMIVFGAALTVAGTDFVRQFLPAVAALAFLIPIPGILRQEIARPLQEITAAVTQAGMELFGSPVTRAGSVLRINDQEVAVAEACNGMRMVAALGLVSYAFVFSVPMRQWVRVLILGVSPLVAIVCNVIRLVPTVLLYGYGDLDVAQTFHDLSGWAMLVVALGILWSLLMTLRWIEAPISPHAVAEGA